MEVEILSESKNPLLRRREVHFKVEHGQTGSTPLRMDIRRAVADALKADVELVFVKKFETKTGTQTAVGVANVYDSVQQAKLIEPEYVIKRNIPPEEPKGEEKE